jgi:hypothetical protein
VETVRVKTNIGNKKAGETPAFLFAIGEKSNLFAVVHSVLKDLGWFKFNSLVSLDGQGLAGARVAAFTLGALDYLKDSQTENRKTAVFLEGLNHRGNNALQGLLSLGLGKIAFLSDLRDEFGFSHKSKISLLPCYYWGNPKFKKTDRWNAMALLKGCRPKGPPCLEKLKAVKRQKN